MKKYIFLLIFLVIPVFCMGQMPGPVPPTGSAVRLDTSGFTGNLSAADTTSQKAFDTIDAMAAGSGLGTAEVETIIDSNTDIVFREDFVPQGGTIIDTSSAGLVGVYSLSTTEVETIIDEFSGLVFKDDFVDTATFNWDTSGIGIKGNVVGGGGGSSLNETQEVLTLVGNILATGTDIPVLWASLPVSSGSDDIKGECYPFDNPPLSSGGNATIQDRGIKGYGFYWDTDNTTGDYFFWGDDADMAFGNGSSDSAFTVAALVNVVAGSEGTIMSVWDETSGAEKREWRIYWEAVGRAIGLFLYDESANAQTYREMSTSMTIGWHFIVVTYDGSQSNSGITIYVDGLSQPTTTGGFGYSSMESTGAAQIVGAYISSSSSIAGMPLDTAIIWVDKTEWTYKTVNYYYKMISGVYGLDE